MGKKGVTKHPRARRMKDERDVQQSHQRIEIFAASARSMVFK
jgi:hypothetical protein